MEYLINAGKKPEEGRRYSPVREARHKRMKERQHHHRPHMEPVDGEIILPGSSSSDSIENISVEQQRLKMLYRQQHIESIKNFGKVSHVAFDEFDGTTGEFIRTATAKDS